MRRWFVATLGAVAALAVGTGCGSAELDELPPGAEPPTARALTAAPAGRVIDLGPPLEPPEPEGRQEPGGGPEGVVVDPGSGRIAVGVRRPPGLVLLDGTSGEVAQRVALPAAPRHLALDGGDVLLPAETADRFLRIRARDGRVLEDVAVGARPHDVAQLGALTVVGDERGSTLSLLRGGRVERTVRVAAQPGGIVATDDGRHVAVVSVRERVLELYDARTLRRVGRADAGVGPTHVIAWRGRIYVTDTAGDALLVFDVRPGLELVRRVYLPGGPYGIALDSRRARIWVTLTERNLLVELPAHGRPRVLRALPTVEQPNTVAVDASSGSLVVTGSARGQLQLIPSQRRTPLPVPRPELVGP